jgi:Domain of unknown function (DUF5658)
VIKPVHITRQEWPLVILSTFAALAWQLLDAYTTQVGLATGQGYEANPIMRWMLSVGGLPSMYAIKVLVIYLAFYVGSLVSVRFLVWLQLVVAALGAIPAIHNLYELLITR